MTIPTAEELCYNSKHNNFGLIHYKDAARLCIQYTKLHVQAALEAAANSAKLKPYPYNACPECGRDDMDVDKQSILKSYPDERIQ